MPSSSQVSCATGCRSKMWYTLFLKCVLTMKPSVRGKAVLNAPSENISLMVPKPKQAKNAATADLILSRTKKAALPAATAEPVSADDPFLIITSICYQRPVNLIGLWCFIQFSKPTGKKSYICNRRKQFTCPVKIIHHILHSAQLPRNLVNYQSNSG